MLLLVLRRRKGKKYKNSLRSYKGKHKFGLFKIYANSPSFICITIPRADLTRPPSSASGSQEDVNNHGKR